MTDSDLVAGVDLGATHVRAAIGEPDGTILSVQRGTTPDGDGDRVVEAIRAVLHEAIDAANVSAESIRRAGIGSLGPLDREAGRVVDPPNLPGVRRIPVAETVANVLDAPTVLHNDATTGAIGVRFYAEHPPSNVTYVTISSGLGVGALVDGHPLTGENGNAAEAGHFQLDPDSDLACGCGGTGHWEAFCAGERIPTYTRHVFRTEDVSTELQLSDIDAKAVFEAAPDDPLAATVVERFGRWNTLGVATIVQAYDPALVVFGGAVARHNSAAVLEPVRSQLPEKILHTPPEVRLTTLGDETVLRGAIAAAIEARSSGDEVS